MTNVFIIFSLILSLSSCVVQAPKYTMIEQVLSIKEGMTKEEVTQILGIPPYDLKLSDDSTLVLIYKYRVTDRKVLPYNTQPVNGKNIRGKYVDLFVTYSKEGKVISFRSCSNCEDTKFTKIDLGKIGTAIMTTVPAILIYFGLK
ncbi:MAG: outer membrane protein assembly factor BamE [Bacteroidota bacterium]|nr:outer membrane protein assembly factor BamE [Bacteroidota bacterium]